MYSTHNKTVTVTETNIIFKSSDKKSGLKQHTEKQCPIQGYRDVKDSYKI